MKYFILFIFIFCAGCRTEICNKLNNDFESDLASENNRIAGVLYSGIFNKDLSKLTYQQYIDYLKSDEKPSSYGLNVLIQRADTNYFQGKKYGFFITLYYKECKRIICDDSETAFLDSAYTYNDSEDIPELKDFTKKILHRMKNE